MSDDNDSFKMPNEAELDTLSTEGMRNILISEFGLSIEDATRAANGELKLEESVEIQLARISSMKALESLEKLIPRLNEDDRDIAKDIAVILQNTFPQKNH